MNYLFEKIFNLIALPAESDMGGPQRIEDLKNYITNHLIITVAGGFGTFALWSLIVSREPHFVSILISLITILCLRHRAYKLLSIFGFIIELFSPIMIIYSGDFIASAAILVLSSYHSWVFTKSPKLTILHLLFNFILMEYYGLDAIKSRILSLQPSEIAECFVKGYRSVAFICILFVTGLCSLDYVLNRMIDHLDELRKRLDVVVQKLHSQNLQLTQNLEMKEIFIYTFSHELKNALNGLLGNLFLALTEVNDPKTLSFLSIAKVCGEVLKNFVHNVLDSGRLENGNLEVSLERTNFSNVLGSFWAICGELIRNKRLEGSIRVSKEVPEFLDLDQQRLMQILLNFTSNAIKFTQTGGIYFRITWEPVNSRKTDIFAEDHHTLFTQEENLNTELTKEAIHYTPRISGSFRFIRVQGYELNFDKRQFEDSEKLNDSIKPGSKGILKIEIRDTGCGMSLSEQNNLFKKLNQVGNSAANKKIGTGLGLWICKELLNKLGSDVRLVQSAVGIGTTFQILIHTQVSMVAPLKRSQEDYTLIPLRKTGLNPPKNSKPKEKRYRKVLVVDDDSFNLELMRNYMHRLGVEVHHGYNGEEAVQRYQERWREIDVIFTDNNMPKMTGIEAAKEIQKLSLLHRKKVIPIYCLTGDSRFIQEDREALAGILSKPIDFFSIKNILENHGVI